MNKKEMLIELEALEIQLWRLYNNVKDLKGQLKDNGKKQNKS